MGEVTGPAEQLQAAAATPSSTVQATRLVAMNTIALVLSQFVTTPVSIAVNAMLARKLGATDFGAIYLATTVLTVGYLVVEWGGQSKVVVELARDRSLASEVIGTGLLLRVLFVGGLLALIPRIADLMGYDGTVRVALWLCGIKLGLTSLGNLCGSVMRGFERVSWQARATVFANLIDAALVIPTLYLGGGLRQALTAQAVAAGLALVVQLWLVARLKPGRPTIRRDALRRLLGGGLSFLILDLILKLQPYIDAQFLSRMAPAAALGWYGAASRMVGVLIFPCTTLTAALYPTIARLWREDRSAYDAMVRLGLRTVAILGIFAATGTAIFSDLLVDLIYGKALFAMAAGDLRVLAGYILIVYSSIVLSVSLIAAGRQMIWAGAQSFCLLVSVALDPILIPYFEARYGNGGLGVCVSVVLAEIAMLTAGLRLLPAGVLDGSLAKTALHCALGAVATAAVCVPLREIPLLAAPTSVAIYFGTLWLLKELNADTISMVRTVLAAKAAVSARSDAA